MTEADAELFEALDVHDKRLRNFTRDQNLINAASTARGRRLSLSEAVEYALRRKVSVLEEEIARWKRLDAWRFANTFKDLDRPLYPSLPALQPKGSAT